MNYETYATVSFSSKFPGLGKRARKELLFVDAGFVIFIRLSAF